MPRLAACRALSSTPGSKGCDWTRMLMQMLSVGGALAATTTCSTAGHSGEKRHFVASCQWLIQAAEFLITRTHQVLLGQYIPYTTATQQVLAQLIKAGELTAQL